MLAEANTTQRHFEHRKEIIYFLPYLIGMKLASAGLRRLSNSGHGSVLIEVLKSAQGVCRAHLLTAWAEHFFAPRASSIGNDLSVPTQSRPTSD